MRFGKYASLLGLASHETNAPTPSSISASTFSSQSSDSPTFSQNHHSHHHHHHHHSTSLHPTQSAYLVQAEMKEKAISRMGQQILAAENEKKAKRDVNHRPLIITNHLEDETIYPAYSSVEQSGGFKLSPGKSHTELLPAGTLTMFRSWIRRGCTEGPGDNDLTCLTGDCGGKLVCNSWGDYNCGTLAENACFPNSEPPSMFPDISMVQGYTPLPITFSMDGCNTIMSCDPSSIECPSNMQVKDENGKVLTCACGSDDWNNLLQECPNSPPLSDTQKALQALCSNVYAFAENNDAQKYCPYSDNNAMRIDIGNKDKLTTNQETQSATPNDTPATPNAMNQEVIGGQTTNPPSTTTAPPVWGPDSPEWSEWIGTYKWEGTKQ